MGVSNRDDAKKAKEKARKAARDKKRKERK